MRGSNVEIYFYTIVKQCMSAFGLFRNFVVQSLFKYFIDISLHINYNVKLSSSSDPSAIRNFQQTVDKNARLNSFDRMFLQSCCAHLVIWCYVNR